MHWSAGARWTSTTPSSLPLRWRTGASWSTRRSASRPSTTKVRFAAFTSTSKLFLPGGDAPAVGSVFKNPDLAKTYRLLAEKGTRGFYRGPLAEEIAAAVQAPPKTATTKLPVPAGHMTTADLAAYRALDQAPTHVEYRGLDVYGMAPSSSGGTTVGESLNILDTFNLSEMSTPDALHHYLEASALAFADRGKYVGDPAVCRRPHATPSPTRCSARSARAEIDPKRAAVKPVAPGDVATYDGACPAAAAAPADEKDTENISTTNLTVADKWGNVVEYTLTIEQTGGSGIVVPGRGFLLNNELTDFSTVYDPTDPNRIEPGKRPRSSMSPTIILKDGEPFLALGSPGGSTIITTVLQTILNRVDLGMSISEAIAAPRAAQRNTAKVTAEPEFIDAYAKPSWSRTVMCSLRRVTRSRRQQKSARRQRSSSGATGAWSPRPSRSGAGAARRWWSSPSR